jgi:aspartate carbamoyltransferase catalytic subunit
MIGKTGTMSGMPEKAIPQISDSIKATAGREAGFALILNQVENGVAVRMATLYLLAGGE